MKSKFNFRHPATLACFTMLSLGIFQVKNVNAQTGVGINAAGTPADASAGLDVNYSDKGLLIPRVSLTITTSSSPITSPATSLMVYNTATANDVTPGFYYWNGGVWVRVSTGSGSGGSGINCSNTTSSTYTVKADGSGGWECTDALQVSQSSLGSNGHVGINQSPNSSYDLAVDGAVSIGGAFGTTFNSGGDLSMNSNYISMGGGNISMGGGDITAAGTITTSSTVTVGGALYVGGSFGISISSSGTLSMNGNNITMGSGTISTTGTVTTGNLTVGGNISLGSGSMSTSGNVTTGTFRSTGSISSSGSIVCGSWQTGSSQPAFRNSSGALSSSTSTIKSKDNVQPLVFDKEKFLKIRPVTYTYKKAFGGYHDVGVIAENVDSIQPDLVFHGPKRIWVGTDGAKLQDANGQDILDSSGTEAYTVYYDKISVYLLSIVADQEKTIKDQQKALDDLYARLNKQDAILSRLAQSIPELKEQGLIKKEDGTAEANASKK